MERKKRKTRLEQKKRRRKGEKIGGGGEEARLSMIPKKGQLRKMMLLDRHFEICRYQNRPSCENKRSQIAARRGGKGKKSIKKNRFLHSRKKSRRTREPGRKKRPGWRRARKRVIRVTLSQKEG